MRSAPGAERLAIARSEVHRACDLLIAPTPEALKNCEEALARAVSAVQSGVAGGEPATAALANSLGAEITRAGRLLNNLAAFYQGWERILGTMSGGYTPHGAPAAVARQGRICCRG